MGVCPRGPTLSTCLPPPRPHPCSTALGFSLGSSLSGRTLSPACFFSEGHYLSQGSLSTLPSAVASFLGEPSTFLLTAREEPQLLGGASWLLTPSGMSPLNSSAQFRRAVMSDYLQPHGMQHDRPPCPSPTPRVTQTDVHWVGVAIQLSHPLSSPSPPALIFPSTRVFSNESAFGSRWPKHWRFSFNISP